MADSVIIDGFSDDALSSLPDWAKDETLEKILAILKRNLKIEEEGFKRLETTLRQFATGKSSKGGVPDPEKIGKYNKGVDGLLENVDREARQNKKKKKLDDDDNKARTAGAKIFGNLSKKAVLFDAAVASLDYIVAKAIGAMAANVEVSTKLYTAGINVIDSSTGVTDGFQSLAQISMLAGVRLKDVEQIFMKFGNTVTIFGAGKIQKATTMAQKNLSALGYSASESLEFTAAYLDSVKGFTKTQGMSTEQVAASVTKFAGTIKTLSLTTGQSTEMLMQKFNALAKSTDAMILTSQVGAGASTQLLGVLSGITDDNIRKQILSTMVAPVKEMDKVVTSLRASGHADIGQRYIEMNARLKSAQTTEQANAIIKSFGDNLNLSTAELSQLQLQTMSSNSATASAAQETLNIVTAYKQQAQNMKALTAQDKIDIENANKTKAARDRVANAFNRIIANITAIFSPFASVLNVIGAGLEFVAEGFDWLGKTFAGSWVGVLIVAIGSISAIGGTIAAIGLKLGLVFGTLGRVVTNFGLTLLKLPYTIAKLPFQLLGSIVNWLKIGLGKIFNGSVLEVVGSWLGRIGSIFARFLGLVGLLYAAFEAGQAVGTYIYNLIKDFDWFQQGMDGLFGWLDHLLQYIPGQVGRDAKDRIETKHKVEEMQEKDAKANAAKVEAVNSTKEKDAKDKPSKVVEVQITAPKIANRDLPITNPKPTTVDSVSSDSTGTAKTMDNPTVVPGADNESIAKTSPTAKEPEINSILKYQTSLLEQQLDKIADLLSINRDQLKISRNAS